jgi:periplasmic protein TonB
VRLAEWNRPVVRALLDTVRGAHAASEEENFYARGREKALKLMQQRQFEQAADLLRNLLSLFPADPILERDLQAAQLSRSEEPPAPAPAAAHEPPKPPRETPAAALRVVAPRVTAPVLTVRARFRVAIPARTHVAAVASLALLVLVSASAAVWRLSRNDTPGASRTTAPLVQKATVTRESQNPFATPQPAQPKSAPAPAKPESREAVPAAPDAGQSQAKAAPVPLRPFTAPAVARADTARAAPLIPPPPGTAVVVYESGASGVPASVLAPVDLPAPPPSKPPVATPETVAPPAPKIGGNVQEPKLISSPQPVIPEIAKMRSISGIVKLDATIDKRGVVTNVAVVSGNAILATAAKDAVQRWRYQPATLNGQPLEFHAAIQVVFESGRR